MSLAYPEAASGRSIRFLDVAVAVWVISWIGLGLSVASQVRGLATFSDTVDVAAGAIDQTAGALHQLAGLPIVGGRIAGVESQLRATAAGARAGAKSSKGNVERLSVLLGLSVALAPTVPLVALYWPLRVARVREMRALRSVMGSSAGDAAFEEFLARRAVQHLPYHVLRRVSPNPWRDLEEGKFAALAGAELGRLGIRRPQERGPVGSPAPPR